MTIRYRFILFWLCFGAWSIQAQVNYRHFITAGRIDLSENRNTEAIRNFNIAIQAKPDQFEGWFYRGIAKFSLSDFSGSLSDFSETIRLHPLYARAYHYRGIVNDRLANYYDARADFRKAIGIDPYNADLFVAAGATDMHLGHYRSAVENYDLALLINPKFSAAWLNRGIAHILLGDTLRALNDFDLAVRHDHFDPEGWARRGMLRAENGDTDGALSDLNEAIRLDSQNPALFFQRAKVRLLAGDTLAALNDFEEVNVRDTRNALTYFNRALIHSQLRQYPEAKALYEEVIKINPANIYSYFNLGLVNYELKNYNQSEENFSRCIELFPAFVGAYINRSLVRKALHDKNGAEADYQAAMQLIQKLNQTDEAPEKLFSRYADSAYFDRVMALEADFVSGEVTQQRPQFRNIEIEPFGPFIIGVQSPETNDRPANTYNEPLLEQLNHLMPKGLRLCYRMIGSAMTEVETSQWQIPDHLPPSLTALLAGIQEQSRMNHSRSIEYYQLIADTDEIEPAAGINESVALFQKEMAQSVEQQHIRNITIHQGNNPAIQHDRNENIRPELSKAFERIASAKKHAPENAMIWYNQAYLQLQQGDFQQAIDALSNALRFDPDFGEAYYNRALTLLYVGENKLACTDLGKAGEKGIEEAYAVIRKFCQSKRP